MTEEKRSTEQPAAPVWRAVEKALEEHQGKKRQARRAFRRAPGKTRSGGAAPTEAPTLFLTETLARRTLEILESPAGDMPEPGAVFWFGFEHGERACVTTLIVPEEESRADAILASAVADEEVFSAIVGASLVFLGEVRLAAAEEDHDERVSDERVPDERVPDVRFEGAFAIEVPPMGPFDLEECRVHRQIAGQCRRIGAEELRDHLRLIPGFKDLRQRDRPAARVVTPAIRHVVRV